MLTKESESDEEFDSDNKDCSENVSEDCSEDANENPIEDASEVVHESIVPQKASTNPPEEISNCPEEEEMEIPYNPEDLTIPIIKCTPIIFCQLTNISIKLFLEILSKAFQFHTCVRLANC